MSSVTVEPGKLTQAAGQQRQAAAEAGLGAGATQSSTLRAKLYITHGVISGPSNEAISAKMCQREIAGRTLQQSCLALAAALDTAAALYTSDDSHAAAALDNHMRS